MSCRHLYQEASMSVGSQAFLPEAMLSPAVPHLSPTSSHPLLKSSCGASEHAGPEDNPGQQQPLQEQGPVQHFIELQLKKIISERQITC